MVLRILLIIICVLEVNKMINGYPNQMETIRGNITSHNRDEDTLIRVPTAVTDENQDSSGDVGGRDADKKKDGENNKQNNQFIENSNQRARQLFIQFNDKTKVDSNINNNNDVNVKNQSRNYPNDLISFFDKKNRKYWNHYDDKPVKHHSDRVVFPEEIIYNIFNQPNNNYNKDVPIIPRECEGELFCENVPNYPKDIIRKQLILNSHLRLFETKEEPITITQRVGNNESDENEQDENLCRSKIVKYYPQAAKNEQGVPKFIAQEPDFVQRVDVELCEEPDQSCKLERQWNELGYTTYCQQKYIQRQLIAVSSGTLEPDWFRVQSGCCCHLKFNASLVAK
ncbi:serine/threonine-protein kinase atg1-like [Microplitis demolitor]|uniref:serine/threonine-protein kinase atg1-like n=1 Tax=Microplitis demolitor TaxID=69319 RepID=UPI0004CCDCD1|nr:serine/threonine-protein kinase atg1-like [Microplitis demolitor]